MFTAVCATSTVTVGSARRNSVGRIGPVNSAARAAAARLAASWLPASLWLTSLLLTPLRVAAGAGRVISSSVAAVASSIATLNVLFLSDFRGRSRRFILNYDHTALL